MARNRAPTQSRGERIARPSRSWDHAGQRRTTTGSSVNSRPLGRNSQREHSHVSYAIARVSAGQRFRPCVFVGSGRNARRRLRFRRSPVPNPRAPATRLANRIRDTADKPNSRIRRARDQLDASRVTNVFRPRRKGRCRVGRNVRWRYYAGTSVQKSRRAKQSFPPQRVRAAFLHRVGD